MRLKLCFVLLSAPQLMGGQTTLHQRLEAIAAQAHGHVSVACSLPGTPLDCDLDPHGHPPMQSSFKLPLAMVVLHQVEEGKLKLDQPVRFLQSDRYPTYSPLQVEFPEADVDIPVRRLIEQSVENSDNIGANLLWRLIGGGPAFQQYMDSLGLAIHQQDSEFTLHGDQMLQYRNNAEPAAMVALLRLLADHSPLNAEHTALLNEFMLATATGPKRIKGLLPSGTPVAHKTGSSGEEYGRIPATVDAGLITLPKAPGKPARRLALAVFVTDAHADQETCERVIAEIARAIYDAALAAPQH